MQVQTNNLSQRWIFVAPNELTLEYSLHGNIIEYDSQLRSEHWKWKEKGD